MDQPPQDQPQAAKPPRLRLAQGQEVSLGCGTLILIAIIVAIFSKGRDSGPVEHKLDALDQKIDRLEKKLDDLRNKVAPKERPE